ncbi:GPP34 family phosphoprotein [Kitasatospora sp. NPDC097643]|uniref:GPP34 family phosphoprotein n=1 Tax=Kitasatospora sp. NPDC097643 TaxID=3157230 RepID=UPI00331BBD4F
MARSQAVHSGGRPESFPGCSRTVPGLLLLWAHPVHGRLRIPSTTFATVIAGAVLAELLLNGSITVDERRITGFQPLGVPGRVIADRVAATLRRSQAGRAAAGALSPASPAEERDRQLAGLIGVARLEHRLYPGRPLAPIRRAVRELPRTLPIARAAKRAVQRRSSDGG